MAVTDLTGTKWILHSTIDTMLAEELWYTATLNFTCPYYPNVSFHGMRMASDDLRYQYNGTSGEYYIYDGEVNNWYATYGSGIEIIEFDSTDAGTDKTNLSFISWLEASATQVVPITISLPTLSGWGDLEDGTYTITIRAKNVPNYCSSNKSAGVIVLKGLATPTAELEFGASTANINIYTDDLRTESYKIKVDGTLATTIQCDGSVTVITDAIQTLSLTAGSHTISIAAAATGKADSPAYDLEVTVCAVIYNLTNCTKVSGTPDLLFAGEGASLMITPSTGYELPNSVSITGATMEGWVPSLGVASISNVTGTVTFAVIAGIPKPSAALDPSTGVLNITRASSATTQYKITANGITTTVACAGLITTVSDVIGTFNLTPGTYYISVIASAVSDPDSNPYVITATVCAVNYVLTGCTRQPNSPLLLFVGAQNIALLVAPDAGYELPSSVTITGATQTGWSPDYGMAGITDVTGTVTFTVVATGLPQLDTPTNLSVNSNMIATFDEVENAESYEFFVDNVSIGEYQVQSNYSVTLDLECSGAYDEGFTSIEVYDGTSDAGTRLAFDSYADGPSHIQETVICETGNLYIAWYCENSDAPYDFEILKTGSSNCTITSSDEDSATNAHTIIELTGSPATVIMDVFGNLD